MNARGPASSPATGHDILAGYLTAYANSRQLSDLERPWGLGDDALDGLWMRLADALTRNPGRLDRLIAEDLTDGDREHIAATISPLIFALPLRAYPAELRAIRSGPRLTLRLRPVGVAGEHHAKAEKAKSVKGEKPATCGWMLTHAPAPRKPRKWMGDVIGFLPAALTASFAAYLRKVLRIPENVTRRVMVVSSGGRRRRVRVTLLAHDRGIVVRFLERLPSAADEGR